MADARDKTHFTIVFKGDLSQFPGNVFKADFPHGEAVAAGFGDLMSKLTELEQALDDAYLGIGTLPETHPARVLVEKLRAAQ